MVAVLSLFFLLLDVSFPFLLGPSFDWDAPKLAPRMGGIRRSSTFCKRRFWRALARRFCAKAVVKRSKQKKCPNSIHGMFCELSLREFVVLIAKYPFLSLESDFGM